MREEGGHKSHDRRQQGANAQAEHDLDKQPQEHARPGNEDG